MKTYEKPICVVEDISLTNIILASFGDKKDPNEVEEVWPWKVFE